MYLSHKTSIDGKIRFEKKSDLVPEPTVKARKKSQTKASKLLKKNIALGKIPDEDENYKK